MINDSGHSSRCGHIWKTICPFVAFFHPDEAIWNPDFMKTHALWVGPQGQMSSTLFISHQINASKAEFSPFPSHPRGSYVFMGGVLDSELNTGVLVPSSLLTCWVSLERSPILGASISPGSNDLYLHRVIARLNNLIVERVLQVIKHDDGNDTECSIQDKIRS